MISMIFLPVIPGRKLYVENTRMYDVLVPFTHRHQISAHATSSVRVDSTKQNCGHKLLLAVIRATDNSTSQIRHAAFY